MLIHPLKPIYNKYSKILILGSFPSSTSRKNNFYYAHKSNRFWKIFEVLFNINLKSNLQKKKFLLNNNIALWDVLHSCDIKNSRDSSIKNPIPNDIKTIINKSNIKYLFITGKTAYNLYNKYFKNDVNIKAVYLPSPSSANAKYTLDNLVKIYKKILLKL